MKRFCVGVYPRIGGRSVCVVENVCKSCGDAATSGQSQSGGRIGKVELWVQGEGV